MTDEVRAILQQVFNKTYLEQALGGARYGVIRLAETTSCAYHMGCAIGRSLPEHVAERVSGSIAGILAGDIHYDESLVETRRVLTGSETRLGSRSATVLAYQELQGHHDHCALRDLPKETYRERLEEFALKWNLTLPEVICS